MRSLPGDQDERDSSQYTLPSPCAVVQYRTQGSNYCRKILNTHARIFVNRGLIRFGFGEGSKKYGKCAELYSYLLHDVVRASESSIQQSSSPASSSPASSIQHPAVQHRPADTSIQYKHYSHIHHAWTRVKRYQRSFRRLQAHQTVN